LTGMTVYDLLNIAKSAVRSISSSIFRMRTSSTIYKTYYIEMREVWSTRSMTFDCHRKVWRVEYE